MTKKKEAVVEPEVVQADQFMNVNDWPLYRSLELFRVKENEGKPGEMIKVAADGSIEYLHEAELLASYEPVKGLHKRAF